ncbi:ATP synthase subunit C [Candidatus Albibeggiatoa sp. nov. BB20]|uniref:ATP synthase subunit C n=1 Tax=Candidatus Albibeggiatoa sp. nov. BB20 TaxID=3162723 RepID=UPI0033659C1C
MYWLLALMSMSLLGMIGLGLYAEFNHTPKQINTQNRMKGIIAANLLLFVSAQLGLLFLGMQDAMAAETVTATKDISIGMGLAMIGAGIPTAVATIGAGIAVGPVGAASLAVIAEKPEVFGRSLVYLGLAEGIAIYGLVVTILMLGKI